MSSPEAYSAIHDYLVQQWTGPTLHFENEGAVLPNVPDYFIFVEIFGTSFDQASIGAETAAANLWRELGEIIAYVMIPRDSGTLQGRTYAKQFANLFRGQEIAGVIFRDASIGAAEAGEENGSYFRLAVTIDWERDDQ